MPNFGSSSPILMRAITIPDDFAKTYNWTIKIPFLQNKYGVNHHEWLAETTQIPEERIEPIVVQYKAWEWHIAGRQVSSRTLDITFKEKDSWEMQNAIRDWMGVIHNPNTGGGQIPSAYKSTIFMNLMNGLEKTKLKLKLDAVWPSALNAVDLDYNNKDIVKVVVTFSFDKCTKDTGGGVLGTMKGLVGGR